MSGLDAGISTFGLHLELQTYPGGALVPTDGFLDRAPRPNAFAYGLAPRQTLLEGWYTILLDPFSDLYFQQGAPEGPAGPIIRSDGKYESHFRVGSSPLLLSVDACASTDNGLLPKLLLWFSEPVQRPAPLPVQITADGAATACAVYMADAASSFLTCDPAIPAHSTVVVSIAEGITSVATGAPLKDADGHTQITVEVPNDLQPYQGCRAWHELKVPTL